MNLVAADAQWFFKLFLALLAYTNRQRQVVENVATVGDIHKLGKAGTASIVNWKHRVSDEFYWMRYFKKYAVFMPAKKSDHLYGVLGLYDPIKVVVRGQPLPVLLKTTLLPFKATFV